MQRRMVRSVPAWLGGLLLGLLGLPAQGQQAVRGFLETDTASDTVIPAALAQAAQPAESNPPPKDVKAPTPESPATPPQEPNAFGNEGQGQGAGTGLAGLAAPNMIGDLLGAGRSVSFFVNRSAGAGFINAVGSTSLVNPNVADNNSPVPLDRVYFRYNHFADALSVSGASSQPGVPIAPGVVEGFTTTRSYNFDEYTFGFEKTFAEGLGSVEFRLPFGTTLSNDLNLSYGQLTSNKLVPSTVPGIPGLFYQTAATPQNTLGNYSTQLGDLTLIFKWLFLQRSWLYFSGGVAATVPTAPGTRVQVTDFLGTLVNQAEYIRHRDFNVANQTWGLSPYLAALVTPTPRLFMQGFLQYDAPLNTSAISYTETVQATPTAPPLMAGNGRLAPPFTVNERIAEQSLLHVDLGTGFWLVRDPQASWLTGLAPAAELYYTTTLNNADVVSLPGDLTSVLNPALHRFVTNPPPPVPTVGNLRNRVDIVDLTLGTTFEFVNRLRLATAVTLPLSNGDNRTFDWELHLQLNYYFGASRATRLPPPTF